MIDDLNRQPERPTDRRYLFETPACLRLAVWADSIHEARDLVERHLVDYDAIWVGTSPPAGVLIEGAR